MKSCFIGPKNPRLVPVLHPVSQLKSYEEDPQGQPRTGIYEGPLFRFHVSFSTVYGCSGVDKSDLGKNPNTFPIYHTYSIFFRMVSYIYIYISLYHPYRIYIYMCVYIYTLYVIHSYCIADPGSHKRTGAGLRPSAAVRDDRSTPAVWGPAGSAGFLWQGLRFWL